MRGMSRARRPSFSPSDQEALLKVLGEVRHRALLCGSAAGYGSPRHELTARLSDAIDDVAADLTGDREHFWDKGSARVGPGRSTP
jgi:hypothetical protein